MLLRIQALIRALTRIPPPALFVAALLAGVRIDAARPHPVVPAGLARPAGVVGVALIALGVVTALSAVALFVRLRTTIVPHHRSRALVTSGPFRFTRNPMYLALSCVFGGAALLANALWPLALLVLPLGYLRLITIPREERLLLEAFGAEYAAYRSRVRRWL